jgi:type II secretory pathway pseudopilin PulG
MRTSLSLDGRRRHVRLPPSDSGASLTELLIVLVLAAGVWSTALPVTGAVLDNGRTRQAAAFVASRLREARQRAVTGSAGAALVFDLVGSRWTFRLCVDGNGNGVRRAELTGSGPDGCATPEDLETMFPGVRVSVDPNLTGPDGDPASSDPLRFGRSDMASCSPLGSCTAGSVYLRSDSGLQFAVRVAGVTGRTRILRYDMASRTWRQD